VASYELIISHARARGLAGFLQTFLAKTMTKRHLARPNKKVVSPGRGANSIEPFANHGR
jgi:hypothetical protein